MMPVNILLFSQGFPALWTDRPLGLEINLQRLVFGASTLAGDHLTMQKAIAPSHPSKDSQVFTDFVHHVKVH
jgi:hypothetical protein